MACAGSVRLTRDLPNYETAYAREGTFAHAWAAYLNGGSAVHPEQVMDEDMAFHVATFVDYCTLVRAGRNWIEKKFDLASLNPPEPMFGTADFVTLNHTLRELEVVDLKYGQGVVVEVYENKQTLYYALGAYLSLSAGERAYVDTVKITIVQPRAPHTDGVIRSQTLDVVDLLGFANELMTAAERTQAPDAPLNPGTHCRFCPASGICPAQLKIAQETAMTEFADMPLTAPPVPTILSDAEFFALLPKVHLVEAWAKAMYARAEGMLSRNEAVPGFKLVARRANRSWVDEDKTVYWLRENADATSEDMFVTKLKSPAQIEKLVGKSKLPPELVQKVSSGVTMVGAADPRPAVVAEPGDDFGPVEG